MEKWKMKKKKLREQNHIETDNFTHEQMEMFRVAFSEEFRESILKIEDEIEELYGEKVLYEFLCSVDYYHPNGEWEWVDGIGAIDKSLVFVIKRLNELGYKTKYCCSGIRSEHKSNVKEGYIMFECDDKNTRRDVRKAAFKTRMLVEVTKEITYKDKTMNKSEKITIRNEQKYDWQTKRKWKKFLKEIEKIKNKYT